MRKFFIGLALTAFIVSNSACALVGQRTDGNLAHDVGYLATAPLSATVDVVDNVAGTSIKKVTNPLVDFVGAVMLWPVSVLGNIGKLLSEGVSTVSGKK